MRVVVKRSIKKCLLWGWSLGTPDLGASQLSLKSETCSKEFTKEMLSLGLGSWSPRSGREPAKLLGIEDYSVFLFYRWAALVSGLWLHFSDTSVSSAASR